jgi:hypothetical protein
VEVPPSLFGEFALAGGPSRVRIMRVRIMRERVCGCVCVACAHNARCARPPRRVGLRQLRQHEVLSLTHTTLYATHSNASCRMQSARSAVRLALISPAHNAYGYWLRLSPPCFRGEKKLHFVKTWGKRVISAVEVNRFAFFAIGVPFVGCDLNTHGWRMTRKQVRAESRGRDCPTGRKP